MQELQLLNERLGTLLERYQALQAENKRLKATVAQQAQSIELLNGKLATAEQRMTTLQLSGAVQGDAERIAMRKQLDTVIGEIDKILHTLND